MKLAGLLPPDGRGASEESRNIRLEEHDVVYTLRRSSRRSFALQVDPQGVRVAVPWLAREAEIDGFIRKHGRWLIERLASHANRGPAVPFALTDGSRFPVFGEECRLRVEGRGRSFRWRPGADGLDELVVPLAADVPRTLIRALRARALPWFAERLAEYCFRLGEPVPALRLSSARTRWGSCSSRSGIRLHWRLIHLAPDLIDYVVAHEVAHLIEMNHSPRFWAVVGRLYPEWREARARLREAGRSLPVFEIADGMALTED